MKQSFVKKSLSFGFALCLAIASLQSADDEKARLESLKKMRKVMNEIEENYVDKIGIDEIINKAIEGLIANLDAHSSYLDKKQFNDLQSSISGEFGGIGISIGMKDGALTIIAPIDNTPADKAGLKAGDIILKINNENTLNMSLDNAVELMRGKPKTKIELTIVRDGEKKPLTFQITRDVIKTESVKVKRIQNSKYAYVRVSTFDKNVTTNVRNGLKSLGKVDGIILDLRNNPGGMLNQAVDLTKLFVKNGLIVSQKGRKKGENVEFRASGSVLYPDTPLAVLINGGSASASEIVAGSLQDHRRAVLIGETTFGKGSVQAVIPVSNGEAIKLTIARYYLPSDRTIQAIGVTPDVIVYPGKVEKNENEFAIKEANLKRHLKNELAKMEEEKNKGDANAESKDEISEVDLYEDTQLKAAYDALKTLSIFKVAKTK